jgi:hypothetical protein
LNPPAPVCPLPVIAAEPVLARKSHWPGDEGSHTLDAWSTDSRRLLIAHPDGRVWAFRPETRELSELPRLAGLRGALFQGQAAWDRSGRPVIAARDAADNPVIWRYRAEDRTWQEVARAESLSQDGRRAVRLVDRVRGWGTTRCEVIDLETGADEASFPLRGLRVAGAEWHDPGRLELLCDTAEGGFRQLVYDARTRRLGPGNLPEPPAQPLPPRPDLEVVVGSPLRELLRSVRAPAMPRLEPVDVLLPVRSGNDGALRLPLGRLHVDLRTGEGIDHQLYSTESPDRRWIVVGAPDRTLRLLDTAAYSR